MPVEYCASCAGYIKNIPEFHKLMEKLSYDTSRLVRVWVPHGCAIDPIETEEDVLHVYIWSTAASSSVRACHIPDMIWNVCTGEDLDFCKNPAFYTSGDGIQIVSGDFTIAELIDYKHLYISCDLTHCGSACELEVTGILIDKVATILNSKLPECSANS